MCVMLFLKTLQAGSLLPLRGRVGPSSSRQQRSATPSFPIEGNSRSRAGEEVEPWHSHPLHGSAAVSAVAVCHASL